MTPRHPPRFKVVDLFAGGGGASLGIEQALGVAPMVAVNHCPAAIAMHAANHPQTIHLTEDVFEVSPWSVEGELDLLWASPSCTHFSRARGGKPVREQLRTLGWVVVEWARAVAPRFIVVENVPEMLTWGPLHPDGTPIAARKGETFQEWVKALDLAGYRVERRILSAADYGTPTIRKRLFVVARRDRQPIVWPEPTHGPGLLPCRTAAECIDWRVPSCSIFASPEEAKEFAKLHGRGTPKRPLADNTLRRVAAGIVKYGLTGTPFLINLSHGGRLEGLDAPVGTLTATPEGGDRVLVSPVLTRAHGHGWDRDGGPSTPGDGLLPTTEPAPTVTASGQHIGLVTAGLVNLTHGVRLEAPGEPVKTITAAHRGEKAVITAGFVSLANSEREGQAPRVRGVDEPLATITATGSQPGLVTAFLAKHYGGVVGQGLGAPMGTVTAIDHHSVVAADLAGSPLSPEQLAGARRVAAFLIAYYGSEADGQALNEPLRTITTLARLGLVTVTIQGEPWVIVDIQLRMLEPHELLVAQGFPATYRLTGTRAQQIARIGNSVCPPVVAALLRSLFADDLQGRPSLTRTRPRADTPARPRTPARATHAAPLFSGSNAAK